LRPNFRLRKQRSVHLAIAMTMLAVPASAVALTSADTAPGPSTETQLQLQVVPRHLKYNHPVTVTGRGPASTAGQKIELQTATSGASSWHRLGSATIDRRGRFRLMARLRRSGLVRVARPGIASTATVARAFSDNGGVAASAARPIAVAAQLRVGAGSRDLLSGDVISVRGRLLPALAGRTVRLQGHFPGGWHTLARTRTGAGGGFRLRSTPQSGLQRRLRVLFVGDQVNAPTASSAGRFTVYQGQGVASWYDDGGATACGFHAAMGVANRSLPCATKVRIRYGGHAVTAVVDDRGPFVGGRDWDLNQNTAAALDFDGVGTVWTTQ
jgi:rare lipoprotein A